MPDNDDLVAETPAHGAIIPSDELAYRLRQQQLVADFGYYALKTEALPALLQEATRVAAEGLNVKFAKVLEHRRHERGFLMVAGVGWRDGLVGIATVGDDLESPAGYAFQTGTSVISNHLADEQRFRTPKMLLEHGIKRAMNVIIGTEECRYGVLEADTTNEGRFEKADVAFLESFANLLGVAVQRAQREEALRGSEERLQVALTHQEVLTSEISHRVKNSLAIVSGLLTMQSRASTHEDVKHALTSASHRVHTIAAVHDRLWRQRDVRSVDLKEFVSDLCKQFAAATSAKSITCSAPSISLASDQAVTLGLLFNELVTNVFKYAYDGADGPVSIELVEMSDNIVELIVADQGRGMPQGLDPMSGKSLGLKLIASLSQQLGATPQWDTSSRGTTFRLKFKIMQVHA